jgi:bidirectional [NiFe] hydrogenase diaphorase subunit
VATFYNYFTMKPPGEHSCIVCLGTACYIKGSSKVLSEVEQVTQLAPGETTSDKKVSLLIARCFGTCGLAPVATFDGEVVARISPAQAAAKVKEWLKP